MTPDLRLPDEPRTGLMNTLDALDAYVKHSRALTSIATAAVALVGERDQEIERLEGDLRVSKACWNAACHDIASRDEALRLSYKRASAAEAECGRLRKDAERYRLLRDKPDYYGTYGHDLWVGEGMMHTILRSGESLDKAIDAAISGSAAQGEKA